MRIGSDPYWRTAGAISGSVQMPEEVLACMMVETFTHFTQKEGLCHNSVQSILEDSHGHFWFGTDGGGVSMFDGETFRYFTEKEGLSDNFITSILEDSTKNIWLGTL